MTSPLPAGVRLWIWPSYVVEVDGIRVKLGRLEGRLLTVLITGRNKLWTVDEIIDAMYGDREDGGPLYAQNTVYVRTNFLKDKFAKRGIALEFEVRGHTRRLARIYVSPVLLAAEAQRRAELIDRPTLPPRSLPLPRIYRTPDTPGNSMRLVMPAQSPDRHRFLISKYRKPAPPRPPRRKKVRLVKWAEHEAEHRPVYTSPHEAPWVFPERVEVHGKDGWTPTPHRKWEG